MLGVVFFSALNDTLMRFGGEQLAASQVTFMRFFITLITITPFVLIKKGCLKTSQPGLHVWRALIGTVAIVCGYFAVQHLPLSSVTTLFFVQPLFFLPLAHLFLREHIGISRISATLLGFVGVVVTGYTPETGWLLTPYMFYPLAGALLFAVVDLLTKRMVDKETPEALLFYFALGSTIITAFGALGNWQWPTAFEWFVLISLGISANLIQLCLYYAFKATEASLLSPFKYTELLFSSLLGFVFFGEVPALHVMMGAALIILSTYYVSRNDPLLA